MRFSVRGNATSAARNCFLVSCICGSGGSSCNTSYTCCTWSGCYLATSSCHRSDTLNAFMNGLRHWARPALAALAALALALASSIVITCKQCAAAFRLRHVARCMCHRPSINAANCPLCCGCQLSASRLPLSLYIALLLPVVSHYA